MACALLSASGAPWHWLPHEFPPWQVVYQQTQRWIHAGAFHQHTNRIFVGGDIEARDGVIQPGRLPVLARTQDRPRTFSNHNATVMQHPCGQPQVKRDLKAILNPLAHRRLDVGN